MASQGAAASPTPPVAESAPSADGSSDVAATAASLFPPFPSSGWRGWAGPLAATVVGGLLRFVNLGRPDAFAFDEVYYAKDALALLRYGHEQQFDDSANELILASDGNWRTIDVFKDDPAFVVHPPFGKWVIAGGEWLFGVTPFGWRFAVAVLGTLSILMAARIARRLTRSDLIGTVTGVLVALDGMHLVTSRTAVLDMVLSFTVLAAFGCLLVWFRLTGWMWRYLREPLWVLMTVLLFTPTIVDPAKEQFAPAVAISAMDLLLDVGNNVWRAVADLAMYSLIALALYLLFVAIRWPLVR